MYKRNWRHCFSTVLKQRVANKVPAICALTVLLFAQQSSSLENANIVIDAPEKSVDGAFVVRVSLPQLASDSSNVSIELWRSHNNSEFQLVTTQASMSEIAQNLSAGGQYSYQARLVTEEHGAKRVHSVSNTEVIDVTLRYPHLSSMFSDF